ncbi:MAG: OmpH family outer membrane protein [Sphingomonadaceae bacterium]|nr:OmpH family outer membrane protein [Sphingomonadaceae bacterium]
MNKYLFSAAMAAIALGAPAVSQAQPLPAPVIAVVNLEQIIQTCTACVAANTQLQAQLTQLQQRSQQLQTQIQTEGQQLQAAVNALPQGQQPDAALQARINAFETMRNNAQVELSAGQTRLQRNVDYVHQQEGERIRPAILTVMQQRGANVVMDRAALIDAAPSIDVTPAVLAIVNQNAAPLNVNAPAQAAPAAPTAPRPTAPAPTTPRPRPQGR